MNKYLDYKEAITAAINSSNPVCVLSHKNKKEEYIVADTAKEQGKLIKQGYRPA